MEIVKPSVELLPQHDFYDHVARCARVCYDSYTEQVNHETNIKFVRSLVANNHLSVLRHYTNYAIIPYSKHNFEESERFFMCPYIQFAFDSKHIYCAANGQFMYDYEDTQIWNMIKDYEVMANTFFKNNRSRSLMRHTFIIIASIATTRELNRVSPNNICERSTRYVRTHSICASQWFEDRDTADSEFDELRQTYIESCENAFAAYDELIKQGLKQEYARGVLPLDTITEVAYTYSIDEWSNIINNRYFNATGKTHPDAHYIVEQIKNQLEKLGYEFTFHRKEY